MNLRIRTRAVLVADLVDEDPEGMGGQGRDRKVREEIVGREGRRGVFSSAPGNFGKAEYLVRTAQPRSADTAQLFEAQYAGIKPGRRPSLLANQEAA